MRIVCWQTILMKYHSLFLSKIRKNVAKFVVRWVNSCAATEADDRLVIKNIEIESWQTKKT